MRSLATPEREHPGTQMQCPPLAFEQFALADLTDALRFHSVTDNLCLDKPCLVKLCLDELCLDQPRSATGKPCSEKLRPGSDSHVGLSKWPVGYFLG